MIRIRFTTSSYGDIVITANFINRSKDGYINIIDFKNRLWISENPCEYRTWESIVASALEGEIDLTYSDIYDLGTFSTTAID